MKNKIIGGAGLVAVLVALSLSGCASEECERCENGGENQAAKLLAQAKVSKEIAQASALAKVPGGTVKDGELEKEKGKLIWSFDITMPDSKDIKEVAMDAITGEVIAVDTESAADQAKEAAEDTADAKKKGAADKD
jgi:hypothetical protein